MDHSPGGPNVGIVVEHRNRKQRQQLAPRFLRAIYQLRQDGLPQLGALGETLHVSRDEIASMWRFTRNNGIAEGFHNSGNRHRLLLARLGHLLRAVLRALGDAP